jgi:hypothetical protein
MNKLQKVAEYYRCLLIKKSQMKTKTEGGAMADLLRQTVGLKKAFFDFIKEYKDHPENFYLQIKYHLVPENKQAPEGVPPKEWIPRYDRNKSSAAAVVRLRNEWEDSSPEHLLPGFEKQLLNIFFSVYEKQTSNPLPRPELEDRRTIMMREEIIEKTI